MNRNRTNSGNNFDDLDREVSYEDQQLVAFLQLNKPIAPEPTFNLEQRLMGEINNLALPQPKSRSIKKLWRKGLLVASGAIAASIMSVWAVNRQLQPATMSAAERAQIEASLLNNWTASVGDDVDNTNNSFLTTDEETHEP